MNIVTKRVLVSLFFIPLILLVLFNGGIYLLILLSLIVLLATAELRNILKTSYPTIPLIFIPLNIIYLVTFSLRGMEGLLFSFLTTFIIVTATDIFKKRIKGSAVRTALSLFSVTYIAFFLSYAYHISRLAGGNYLLISLIGVIWITDTFAFFLGMALGKHRNIFIVSPKKSLEGYIAGLIGAIVSSLLIHLLFREHYTVYHAVIIGITAGIFGQFGDLVESMIKRDTGVKDSSALIPGHGGVLDRFDSFIISLPVFYLLNNLFL